MVLNTTTLARRCRRGASTPSLEDDDIRRRAAPRAASIAPFVLDGPINKDAFETYVAKVLVPELRPGDIVIMDMCGRPRWCKKNSLEEARRVVGC